MDNNMTQDQIIQMLHKVIAENSNFTTWTVSTPHLVALVNHAIEAEREACAKLCDFLPVTEEGYLLPESCANAIRARGQA
jgi:hypothetical protein